MTNDQGRLMILYIIDYIIIKVNRASSVLNVGPRELHELKLDQGKMQSKDAG